MSEKNYSKSDLAIRKLTELTQDSKLRWEIVDSSRYLSNEDTIDASFVLNYASNKFLLFKKAFLKPNTIISASALAMNSEVKDYRPTLCLFNSTQKIITYTFPYSELVNDLYKAASYNAAGVDEIISRLLNEQ